MINLNLQKGKRTKKTTIEFRKLPEGVKAFRFDRNNEVLYVVDPKQQEGNEIENLNMQAKALEE